MHAASFEHLVLVRVRQAGQIKGYRRTQRSIGHALARQAGQFGGKGKTAYDPFLLMPQKPGNGGGGKLILRNQGFDHQAFSQRTDRARGRIGFQQHSLVRGG